VKPLVPGTAFEFVVAWSEDAAQDSGEYHRHRDVDAAGMRELARIARAAADAFTSGDEDALESLMGESAGVRDQVAPLPAQHNALANSMRAAGLTPNSCGSGGAAIALVRGAVSLDVPFVLQTSSPSQS
jgi:hypothetical protein